MAEETGAAADGALELTETLSGKVNKAPQLSG